MNNKINENQKITLTLGQLKRLVKESDDEILVREADNDSEATVKYGTDPIQCSCQTVTKDGMGTSNFQIDINNHEKWLESVGARETYEDIRDDILLGTEVFVHLANPITAVSLTMPRHKV